MERIIVIMLLSLVIMSVHAQGEKSYKIWLGLGLGMGATDQCIVGAQVQPAFLYKHLKISVNYVDFEKNSVSLGWYSNQDMRQKGKVLSILGGYNQELGKFRASLSSGISYNNFYRETNHSWIYKWNNTIGIPVAADLDWLLTDNFALKTSFYYNYNSEVPFYMCSLGFSLGIVKL